MTTNPRCAGVMHLALACRAYPKAFGRSRWRQRVAMISASSSVLTSVGWALVRGDGSLIGSFPCGCLSADGCSKKTAHLDRQNVANVESDVLLAPGVRAKHAESSCIKVAVLVRLSLTTLFARSDHDLIASIPTLTRASQHTGTHHLSDFLRYPNSSGRPKDADMAVGKYV